MLSKECALLEKYLRGIELNPREVLFEKIPKAICHDNSGGASF